MGKTFVEKILQADCGSIVFARPNIVLTHDNSASIAATFAKMNGEKVADPNQLLIVLDHNAPPTSSTLADDYQKIREFVKKQGITKFHDVGKGICHQIMSEYAKPGMIIVGVPESVKITLKGELQEGVYAKDLALWIIGMIGSDGADYMSIEYHGDGVKTLSISDRMTLANLASEMGYRTESYRNLG